MQQVSEEVIAAGAAAFQEAHEQRFPFEVRLRMAYLAMRSKDHSIAVDDVERVATAMLAPLGYVGVKSLAEAESIWVGSNVDDAETGSLAYLCRSLARAALVRSKLPIDQRNYMKELVDLGRIAVDAIVDNEGESPAIIAMVIANRIVLRFPDIQLGPTPSSQDTDQ